MGNQYCFSFLKGNLLCVQEREGVAIGVWADTSGLGAQTAGVLKISVGELVDHCSKKCLCYSYCCSGLLLVMQYLILAVCLLCPWSKQQYCIWVACLVLNKDTGFSKVRR